MAQPLQDIEQKLLHRLTTLKQTHTRKHLGHLQDWVGKHLALLGIPAQYRDMCMEILEYMTDVKIIWLHLQECSGCTESLLRTQNPSFEVLLFDIFRIQYHDTFMIPSGHKALEALESSIENEKYVLLVEGSVPMGDKEHYLTIGSRSGYEELSLLIKSAQAIFAIGTCSSYGGVQNATPNPSNSYALHELFSQDIVHIPGCPPSDINIIASLLYYYLFAEIPPLDALGRPLWAYGKSVHDLCERKGAFLSGKFAQDFNDKGMQEGYCLYKVGCKGPYAYNNCPKVQFNAKTSWPVRAGHGCIACSEPNFWDNFGTLEEPMKKDTFFTYHTHTYKSPKTPILITQYLDKEEEKINFAKNKNLHKCLFIESNPTATSMYLYEHNTLKQNLALSFESNIRVLLQQIESKNKQGKSLCEQYHKYFGDNIKDIMALNDISTIKANLYDAFTSILMLFGSKVCESSYLIKLAKECKFPHISSFGLKLKKEGDMYNWNFQKAISVALAYYVGGLDIYGLSYSMVCEIVNMFCDVAQEQECDMVLSGEIFTHFFKQQSNIPHTIYLVQP